jgi:hypothetical protein
VERPAQKMLEALSGIRRTPSSVQLRRCWGAVWNQENSVECPAHKMLGALSGIRRTMWSIRLRRCWGLCLGSGDLCGASSSEDAGGSVWNQENSVECPAHKMLGALSGIRRTMWSVQLIRCWGLCLLGGVCWGLLFGIRRTMWSVQLRSCWGLCLGSGDLCGVSSSEDAGGSVRDQEIAPNS